MKHHLLALVVALMLLSAMLTSCSNANASGNTTPAAEPADSAVVYVTRDLSPEALVRIYEAVGRPATGRIALKISTGESSQTGYIRPEVMKPLIADYGILASTDPVAVDQACFDIVTQIHNDEHNNNQPLLERIESRHGTHIMEWGEHIGLGSRKYVLMSID